MPGKRQDIMFGSWCLDTEFASWLSSLLFRLRTFCRLDGVTDAVYLLAWAQLTLSH